MTLRQYLQDNGISQNEFSARCNLPQTTIAAIVMGGGTQASTALKIIEATGGLVSLSDLVGRRNAKG